MTERNESIAREARNVPSFDWTRNGMHIRQSVTEGDYVLREDYEALGKRLSDVTRERDAEVVMVDLVANERDAMRDALQRLSKWDHLDSAADGPYWRTVIDAALTSHSSCSSQGESNG